MRKTLAILCLISTTLNGLSSSADEPNESLTMRIDKLVSEKWSQARLDHDYSDRRVQRMRKQLSRIAYPAANGTVAHALKIADPHFFVAIRECGFSLLDENGETGRTRTHEVLQLNRTFELVIVRLTVLRDQGDPQTTELSAEIRRIVPNR